ncbi:BofC C-terminal domain-containing protein [Anaeromicropila herbilytica]|uniref:Bypass of forespore C C-terminal domain-containing protein n=1 Tax=Anaeromicropila herbilytica TaxID=2785025 RepID=A0A7R7EKP1_9FIRM|nr:BofC C-terminal domain-containing protein [Anaeromicropila herbilytica]BCN30585.1 hypothetical protein bsdtb5_18800 [Anaeromicropila herbilytica]
MKMKKAYIILISFFSLTILFSICYLLSFKSALYQFNKNAVGKDNLLSSYQESIQNSTKGNTSVNTNQVEAEMNQNDNTVAVDSSENAYVTPSTEYELQEYDIKKGSLITNNLNTPDYLIGLTREEVINYLAKYMSDVPLADYEKGLTAFELISFSKDKVVLRKSFNSDLVQYKYYLAVQDGLITVYYSDKKTVYEYTEIEVNKLSEEDQIELNHGKYIKNADELYGVLESYSS